MPLVANSGQWTVRREITTRRRMVCGLKQRTTGSCFATGVAVAYGTKTATITESYTLVTIRHGSATSAK